MRQADRRTDDDMAETGVGRRQCQRLTVAGFDVIRSELPRLVTLAVNVQGHPVALLRYQHPRPTANQQIYDIQLPSFLASRAVMLPPCYSIFYFDN